MDSAILTGFAFALIGSVFMGLYPAPKKLAKQDSVLFTLVMVLAFFLGSVAMAAYNGLLSGLYSKTGSPYFMYSVLIGPIWAGGVYLFIRSVNTIGISKANPWKNFSPLFGIILGFVLLKEYLTVKPFYVIAGGIFVVLSAHVLSKTTGKSDNYKPTDFGGILMAVFAGFLFAVVSILNKMAIPIGVVEQQVVWSASSLISLMILVVILKKNLLAVSKRDNLLAFFAGFIYLGAAYFLLSSFKFLEVSVAYVIIQANVIWAVGVGVIFFHEIDVKKYKYRIFAGVLSGVFGVLLLALAK